MRTITEPSRRSYPDEEISHIYELARFHLENGNTKIAEPLIKGLTEVRPDFAPGWLGLACISILNNDFDAGLDAARKARKIKSDAADAILFEITCLLSLDDLNGAGTLLGEVSDMVENHQITNPLHLRFFRAQLARYQTIR